MGVRVGLGGGGQGGCEWRSVAVVKIQEKIIFFCRGVGVGAWGVGVGGGGVGVRSGVGVGEVEVARFGVGGGCGGYGGCKPRIKGIDKCK